MNPLANLYVKIVPHAASVAVTAQVLPPRRRRPRPRAAPEQMPLLCRRRFRRSPPGPARRCYRGRRRFRPRAAAPAAIAPPSPAPAPR